VVRERRGRLTLGMVAATIMETVPTLDFSFPTATTRTTSTTAVVTSTLELDATAVAPP